MGLFRSKWRRLCLPFIAVCLIVCFKVFHTFNFGAMSDNLKNESILPLKNIKDGVLFRQLLDVAKHLHKANIHARGIKTSYQLRHAIEVFDKILETFGLDQNQIIRRDIKEPRNVCPESYINTTLEYQRSEIKRFEVTKCSHAKPLSQLVTLLIYIEDTNIDFVKIATNRIIDSLRSIENITAIIATNPKYEPMKKFDSNVRYIHVTSKTRRVDCWNMLISEAQTPYVLIARDVDVMTEDSRLERLVRAIEMLQVPVAAGALRYPDGHWDKGCYQSVHRNYTLRYVQGYDESHHDCLFCDYIEGPFIASVKTLKSVPFTDIDVKSGFFEDWFLQLNKMNIETVVCPDSMFHVRYKAGSVEGEGLQWNPFMTKWELYKIMFSNGHTIISNCSDLGYWKSRRAVTPCRLNANAYVIKCMMKACEKEKIICHPSGGTLLGAVKMGKVLPWDYDADFRFLWANRSTAFGKVQDHCSKYNFVFKNYGQYFTIAYKTWIVDAYPGFQVDEAIMLAHGMNVTRVLFDGYWVLAPRNPGLMSRNRFGPEIYKHDVHWRVKGASSGYAVYKPGTFPICDEPEKHDCLDRLNGDGDLQLLDPLP